MNHLIPIDDGNWRLPNHARVVVYERDASDRGLLTIYDCGAAQKPPKAQLLGTLESVAASAEIEPTPTGRTVTLRERATLEEIEPDRYRIHTPEGHTVGQKSVKGIRRTGAANSHNSSGRQYR